MNRLLVLLLFVLVFPAALFAQDQMMTDTGFSYIEKSGMRLQWKVEGSMLKVVLSAPTSGWVSVGFNPTQRMKDANIILGYVESGKVFISDEFGNSPTSHQPDIGLGGIDNITEKGGKESGGVTEISFSIPLDSGDKYDSPLVEGQEHRVILAYGKNGADNYSSYHAFRTTITIKL